MRVSEEERSVRDGVIIIMVKGGVRTPFRK